MAFSEKGPEPIPQNNPIEDQDFDLSKFEKQQEKRDEFQKLEDQEKAQNEFQAEQLLQGLDDNPQHDVIGQTWKEYFWGTMEEPETAQEFRENNSDIIADCDQIADSIQKIVKYLPTEKELSQAIKQQISTIDESKRKEATKYIAYMVRNWDTEKSNVKN